MTSLLYCGIVKDGSNIDIVTTDFTDHLLLLLVEYVHLQLIILLAYDARYEL